MSDYTRKYYIHQAELIILVVILSIIGAYFEAEYKYSVNTQFRIIGHDRHNYIVELSRRSIKKVPKPRFRRFAHSYLKRHHRDNRVKNQLWRAKFIRGRFRYVHPFRYRYYVRHLHRIDSQLYLNGSYIRIPSYSHHIHYYPVTYNHIPKYHAPKYHNPRVVSRIHHSYQVPVRKYHPVYHANNVRPRTYTTVPNHYYYHPYYNNYPQHNPNLNLRPNYTVPSHNYNYTAPRPYHIIPYTAPRHNNYLAPRYNNKLLDNNHPQSNSNHQNYSTTNLLKLLANHHH